MFLFSSCRSICLLQNEKRNFKNKVWKNVWYLFSFPYIWAFSLECALSILTCCFSRLSQWKALRFLWCKSLRCRESFLWDLQRSGSCKKKRCQTSLLWEFISFLRIHFFKPFLMDLQLSLIFLHFVCSLNFLFPKTPFVSLKWLKWPSFLIFVF